MKCQDALYHIFNCYVECRFAFMLIVIRLGVTIFYCQVWIALCNCTERGSFVLISVFMLNAIMLNAIMLNAIMLNAIMLNAIILNAIMLSATMLSHYAQCRIIF